MMYPVMLGRILQEQGLPSPDAMDSSDLNSTRMLEDIDEALREFGYEDGLLRRRVPRTGGGRFIPMPKPSASPDEGVQPAAPGDDVPVL
jgi:hypothetical protein